jgi:hypothetical protein
LWKFIAFGKLDSIFLQQMAAVPNSKYFIAAHVGGLVNEKGAVYNDFNSFISKKL